jgi:hypothetical protein
MSQESVQERIEREASRALLKNAIFRIESALMVGGARSWPACFCPKSISWIPWFAWPVARRHRRTRNHRVTSLTDKAEQKKVAESLFREKYNASGIRDRRLQEKLKEAEQYRQRIQSVVEQQKSGILRDRLVGTTAQVYDWIANMVALARRIDTYRMDSIIRRDIEDVPRDIDALKRRLEREPNASVREQMAQTLDSNQRQYAALLELRGRMDRADLQLDHSLAALGTVYSQILLVGSKDVDSDRADRLRDDIRGQVLALQDLVDSLNEVYAGSSHMSQEEEEILAQARRQQTNRAGK